MFVYNIFITSVCAYVRKYKFYEFLFSNLHYTQTSMKNKSDDKGHGCQKMSNNISKKIKTKNAIKIKIKIYSLKVI